MLNKYDIIELYFINLFIKVNNFYIFFNYLFLKIVKNKIINQKNLFYL